LPQVSCRGGFESRLRRNPPFLLAKQRRRRVIPRHKWNRPSVSQENIFPQQSRSDTIRAGAGGRGGGVQLVNSAPVIFPSLSSNISFTACITETRTPPRSSSQARSSLSHGPTRSTSSGGRVGSSPGFLMSFSSFAVQKPQTHHQPFVVFFDVCPHSDVLLHRAFPSAKCFPEYCAVRSKPPRTNRRAQRRKVRGRHRVVSCFGRHGSDVN
jgi:hypothetical protein